MARRLLLAALVGQPNPNRRIVPASVAFLVLVCVAPVVPRLAQPRILDPDPEPTGPSREPSQEAQPAPGAARPAPTSLRLFDEERPEPPEPPDRAWARLGAPELAGQRGRATRGYVKHRLIHFTFDDGPRLETTPRLLDALLEHEIQATFFVVGRQLYGPRGEERRLLLQRIEEEGHTVAVHTHGHRDLRHMSKAAINQDLHRVERSLEATLGYRPGLFRPPFGGRNRLSNGVVRSRGYTQVLWNVPPEPPGGSRSQDRILARFRSALDRQERHHRGPGSIVLLHDPNPSSVEAFPRLVAEIERRNCALLSRKGEELWHITDDLRPFLYTENQVPEQVVTQAQELARARAARYCRDEDRQVGDGST